MPGDLTRYRTLRRADRTPEPMPADQPKVEKRPTTLASGKEHRFVIQEHHARRLHWDLRLERDGVLVSWAVPKGLPPEPGTQRLAVQTENHPLEYLTFTGKIPRGEYGAGTMSIWDTGTYRTEKWDDGHVEITLAGRRVSGRHMLIRTADDNWLLRRLDPPAAEVWEPVPQHVAPMLATLAELPANRAAERGRGCEAEWGYEFKWDGVRALVRVEGGRPRAWGRGEADITSRYPELREFAESLGSTQVLVDGELVAFDEAGRPSFRALQRRMHLNRDTDIRRELQRTPVSYLIFDLLHLDGRSLLETPYVERRELLESLALAGPHWAVPPSFVGDQRQGLAVQAASREQGLEGVMAKLLRSTYRPGRRSSEWLKVPNVATQEVVIGGWREGNGQFAGQLGALLLGIYDDSLGGALRYVGDVGTGFSDAARADLTARLTRHPRKTAPFATPVPTDRARGARWVRPELVGEVRFRTWTPDGRLRHAAWRGLRADKVPEQVRTSGGE